MRHEFGFPVSAKRSRAFQLRYLRSSDFDDGKLVQSNSIRRSIWDRVSRPESFSRSQSCLSGLFDQEMGVPQGSVLSVTLFALKINSMVKAISPGVECSLYVDDFLIVYRS